jgi:hypothetical protein
MHQSASRRVGTRQTESPRHAGAANLFLRGSLAQFPVNSSSERHWAQIAISAQSFL